MDYNQSEVLSCYYDIYIGGEEIGFKKKELIESITIKETMSKADTATIILNDKDFEFVDDDIFIRDKPIKIEGGWNIAEHRFEFNGYIAAIDVDFDDRGFPKVLLFCMDNTHLMNRKKKCRTWKEVTSKDVVEFIAAEYGVTPEFKDKLQVKVVTDSDYKFKKEESIAQSHQTDIQFLQSLARRETALFVCTLRNGYTLYYGKRELLSEPTAELWYKEGSREVISFRPRINRETKQEEVVKSDINPQTKQVETATATDYNTSRQIQGQPVQTSSRRHHNTNEADYKE